MQVNVTEFYTSLSLNRDGSFVISSTRERKGRSPDICFVPVVKLAVPLEVKTDFAFDV